MRYYLTNMENRYKPLVEEAISCCGRSDIHIDDQPMPMDRLSDPYSLHRPAMVGSFFSIYVEGPRDCSDFWAEYSRVKASEPWQVYLVMVEDDPA